MPTRYRQYGVRYGSGLQALIQENMKVPLDFYIREDVLQISQDLLGKVLCTNIKGQISKAIIPETEAYAGMNDKASHAHGGRRTIRTEPPRACGCSSEAASSVLAAVSPGTFSAEE